MQSLRQIELPYTRSGEIDWNTLGNLLSACILGEVLCASYVDYKYGKRSKDIQADTDWQFYYEEKGVIALRKIQADSPINVFMGRTVIDAPLEDVAAFLENHDRRHEWDIYLADIKEMKRISETDVILNFQLEAKRCFIKMQRELLLYERMKYIEGKYIRTTLSVNLPEFPPKLLRADVRPGTGFVCEPYEGRVDKTLISYVAHIDLTGLPLVVINQAMKRQPMAVYRIRNILSKSQTPAPFFTNSLLATDSTNTTGRRTAHSLTDEVELPVEEFMGTTFRSESILRHHSVPADVHKLSNHSLVERSKIRISGDDESILPGVPGNSTVNWTDGQMGEFPKEPKDPDSVDAVHQPSLIDSVTYTYHSDLSYPNSKTNVQQSDRSYKSEEDSKPDQEELYLSVPELTLASMRNSNNKMDKQHSCSCENVCMNM